MKYRELKEKVKNICREAYLFDEFSIKGIRRSWHLWQKSIPLEMFIEQRITDNKVIHVILDEEKKLQKYINMYEVWQKTNAIVHELTTDSDFIRFFKHEILGE